MTDSPPLEGRAQAMTPDKRDGSEPEPASRSALVEPSSSSGSLSNDYLNHYVEVLMLIEMAPYDPSLSADLINWWPISYLDWFSIYCENKNKI